MGIGTNLDEISGMVRGANSLRGALFALKTNVACFGSCHLSYEYMFRPNSYKRGDLINMTTLPAANTDLYLQHGGTNSDPVLDGLSGRAEPLFVPLDPLCNEKISKYYKNRFFMGLMDIGIVRLAAFPFSKAGHPGYGVLTIFEDEGQSHVDYDINYLIAVGRQLHNSIRSNGQVSRFIGLDEKQLFVLNRMAEGRTAQGIAEELDVTKRTIELRLQAARKKLKARTTTEAVYKAVDYGILL